MIIDLIRHTKPDVPSGVCYGQSDIDLRKSFAQELTPILDKLEDHYDLVISSPLSRCLRLAKKLKTDTLISDKRLMELNFGSWELSHWDSIDQQDLKLWSDNVVHQSPPNGESLMCMHSRVIEFWNTLLTKDHQKVALVTHAGVLRIIHADIFATPLDKIFQLDLGFGAVMRVRYTKEYEAFTVKHL